MRDRLFDAAWPPAVAFLTGLAVFLGVLLTTPPGLSVISDLLLSSRDSTRGLAAAYAVGAAAFLALAVLLLVAPALALAHVGVQWICRAWGRSSVRTYRDQ